MIKITKEKDKYLIEYIDYLNHYDYLEDENVDDIDLRDEMIEKKIQKIKIDLQKLIRDSKGLSGKKD
jgi:hypothetical protein